MTLLTPYESMMQDLGAQLSASGVQGRGAMQGSQVQCLECGQPQGHILLSHLEAVHGMTTRQYAARHPGAATVSDRLGAKLEAHLDPGKVRTAVRGDLVVNLAGVRFPVDMRVDPIACLPEPENYVLPDTGDSKKPVVHILTAIRKRRATWIHGPTGSGKDAIVHFLSVVARIPGVFIEFHPDGDTSAKITFRSFRDGSTVWDEGVVLKALRDGYEVKNDQGVVVDRIPYLVLLSDIDRATPEQLELFRPILDSIQGRVCLPNGEVHPVLKGTRFVATANTVGTGENTMQYVTAQAHDVSLLNRFECFFYLGYPEWNVTAQALRGQFASLVKDSPEIVDRLGEFVRALRKEGGRKLTTPFSHRDAVAALNHASDLIEVAGWRPDDPHLLFAGLRSWFQRLPADAVEPAIAIATVHVKGGINVPKTLDAFP